MKDDTISRAAAIDEWKNDFKGYINALDIPKDDYKGIMEYIDEMPPAQPGCEDAVSRADVDILIEEAQTAWLRGDILLMYPALKKGLKKVPPVTPKQPGWIPVTERLPERYDNYLITTEDEDTDIGTFHPGFKQWSICDADGFRLTDGVLAWCELPKPWEGKEQ